MNDTFRSRSFIVRITSGRKDENDSRAGLNIAIKIQRNQMERNGSERLHVVCVCVCIWSVCMQAMSCVICGSPKHLAQ